MTAPGSAMTLALLGEPVAALAGHQRLAAPLGARNRLRIPSAPLPALVLGDQQAMGPDGTGR